MTTAHDVEALYRALLAKWNTKDAAGYGELFTDDGSIVGFDGSCMESPSSIIEHLGAIFADHNPATYISKVKEVRPIGPGAMLVRGIAGMVPPGQSDIDPDKNVVQVLVAVDTKHGWRIAHFQNTPAAFHGRPEAAQALTEELRVVLSSS